LVSLIEVPEVKGRRMPRGAETAPTWADADRPSRRPSTGRKNRRLRREVRVAGCAFLLLAPLVGACNLGWSSGRDRVLACSVPDLMKTRGRQNDRASATVLAGRSEMAALISAGAAGRSIEPPATPTGPDNDVPVIFSGFVLPDDSLEDSTHEGS
jgi:hypothetical protein